MEGRERERERERERRKMRETNISKERNVDKYGRW